MSKFNNTVQDRFFEKILKLNNNCWEWLASKDKDGYGAFTVPIKKTVRAHIYSYQLHKGAIPDGLELDHLCRNRWCVNPDHLEPVTSQINSKRGIEGSKTHCKNGHIFDSTNTYITPNNRRSCKICTKKNGLKWRNKKRENQIS